MLHQKIFKRRITMKKVWLILAIFCAVCLVGNVWAGPVMESVAKRGELIVGTSGDYPPLTAKKKDGKPMGLDVDLANLIAEAMGVKVKIVFIPFADLLSNLQAGKIDMVISNMTMTPKRNLQFVFVGPYFMSGQSILTTKEASASFNSLEGLNKPDVALAVPAGTTSAMIAKERLSKASLTLTKNMDEAVNLLLAGKVKAVLSDAITCTLATGRFKDKSLITSDPLTFEPIGIAIQPNDPHLTNWLDNFLSMLKGTGALKDMTEKWMNNTSWVADLP
jgi:polar amino acid transport system substrate-binding protein